MGRLDGFMIGAAADFNMITGNCNVRRPLNGAERCRGGSELLSDPYGATNQEVDKRVRDSSDSTLLAQQRQITRIPHPFVNFLLLPRMGQTIAADPPRHRSAPFSGRRTLQLPVIMLKSAVEPIMKPSSLPIRARLAPIVFEAYNGEKSSSAAQTPLVAGAIPGRASFTPPCLGPSAKATMNSLSTGGQEARWPPIPAPTFPSDARSRPEHRSQWLDRNALRFGTQSAKRLLEWHSIHIAPGQAWIAQTGSVTRSGPGYVVFNYQPIDSYELPKAGNAYYLTGTFSALDAGGKWYRSSSGQLYAKMPFSDNPANHNVEVKHRAGLRCQRASLHHDSEPEYFLRDDQLRCLLAKPDRQSHHRFVRRPVPEGDVGMGYARRRGIVLNGPYSLLENSVIQGQRR